MARVHTPLHPRADRPFPAVDHVPQANRIRRIEALGGDSTSNLLKSVATEYAPVSRKTSLALSQTSVNDIATTMTVTDDQLLSF